MRTSRATEAWLFGEVTWGVILPAGSYRGRGAAAGERWESPALRLPAAPFRRPGSKSYNHASDEAAALDTARPPCWDMSFLPEGIRTGSVRWAEGGMCLFLKENNFIEM